MHSNCRRHKEFVYVSRRIVFRIPEKTQSIDANKSHIEPDLAFRIDDESAMKPERLWTKGEKLLAKKVGL